jgi:Icc-related predicted phosphoesterase
MKLTLISDTHGHHRSVGVSETDILIHAGDISGIEKRKGLVDFFVWFSEQPAKYKILIAGNHDVLLKKNRIDIPENIIYLNDTGISLEGLNIWGSPYSHMFISLDNNEKDEGLAKQVWNKIPLNTHILITHTPPKGILDLGMDGMHHGCSFLHARGKLVNPILHVFGHIHEAYGVLKNDQTTYINASIVNTGEQPVNLPVIIEIPSIIKNAKIP